MNEGMDELERKIENLESKKDRMKEELRKARNSISLLEKNTPRKDIEKTQLREIKESSKEMRESLGAVEGRIARCKDRMKELKERRVIDMIDELSEEAEFGAHIDAVKKAVRKRFGIEGAFVDDAVERRRREGDLEEFEGVWYSRAVKKLDKPESGG